MSDERDPFEGRPRIMPDTLAQVREVYNQTKIELDRLAVELGIPSPLTEARRARAELHLMTAERDELRAAVVQAMPFICNPDLRNVQSEALKVVAILRKALRLP